MLLKELKNGRVACSQAEARFEEEYDLIVVGLGTAGAIALIAGAREGLHVLGVERLGGMGGTGTLGTISGYYFGARGGLYEQLNREAEQLEQELYVEQAHCDAKLDALERAALSAGAEVSYETIFTGVYAEGSLVRGLRLFREGRSYAVGARMVIDATGEAELCRMAGCACQRGRTFDRQTQPYTNSSVVLSAGGRRGGINRDAGYVDQSDSLALGRAVLRANTLDIHLKESYRGEERFVAVSPIIGVREGHVLQGRETLRFEDAVLRRRRESQPLFYAFSNADNHGKDIAFEDALLIEWYVVAGLWGLLFPVPVPLKALLPAEYDNLAVAGRALSVDHNLASCVRMKSDMEKCGEAAGYAAALALRQGQPLAEVPYAALAGKLRQSGCLDERNNRGFIVRTQAGALDENRVEFPTAPSEVLDGLDSDAPGIAIWACRGNGERMRPALLEALQTGGERLRRHAALALGLCGEAAALPLLRTMVRERDGYLSRSSLKYVYTRCTAAIYLVGKLGDVKSIPLLMELVRTRGRLPEGAPAIKPDELYASEEERCSLETLFAIRALVDIAGQSPALRQEILPQLHQLVRAPGFSLWITLKANPSCLYDLAGKAAEFVERAEGCKEYAPA